MSSIVNIMGVLVINALMTFLYFSDQLRLFIHPRYTTLFIVLNLISLFVCIVCLIAKLYTVNKFHFSFRSVITFIPLLIIGCSLLLPDKSILMSQSVDDKSLQSMSINTKKFGSCRSVARSSGEVPIEQWRFYVDNCADKSKYSGQRVSVQAFVYKNTKTLGSDNRIIVARLIMACCVVDATPVKFTVTNDDSSLKNLSEDTWVQIEGQLAIDVKADDVIIQAKSVNQIDQPKRPYGYY